MKVKVTVSLGFIDPETGKSYSPSPGLVSDLPDAMAQELIDIGYAEAVSQDEPIGELPEDGEKAPRPKSKRKTD